MWSSERIGTIDMEAKDYLGYIAHFYKNLSQWIPKREFAELLAAQLGPSGLNAPLPKVRDTARLLYKGYVTSAYTKMGAFHIVSHLDSKTIDLYLADVIALNKKYGVYYDTIDHDLSLSNMDKHIKKASLANYRAVFSELFDDPVTIKRVPKKSPVARKTPAKGTRTKSPAKATSTVASKKAIAAKKAAIARAAVTKKSPPKKTVAKKTLTIALKGCDDYKLPELKEMARMLRIPGFGRMKKQALCAALGL